MHQRVVTRVSSVISSVIVGAARGEIVAHAGVGDPAWRSVNSPVLVGAPFTLGCVLHGRASERAAIESLLGRARAGQGGGLVLHGEPGIGKTALFEYAAERAAGMCVLRTAGVEPESDLGYAALHRLLLPVLDWTDRLPEPQSHALGVVFGQVAGSAPDRFLVALATLSLLSEVAGERPVLCLVDDAHWADAPSLNTFTFVANRLGAEPVAMLLAARADEGRPLGAAGLVEVPLAGLDRDAARALLAEYGHDRLSATEQDELLRETGGNPLAIRELPAVTLRRTVLGQPVPLTTGLQRAFLERTRQRNRAAQQVLLLVAADGSGQLGMIRRAAAALGSDAGSEVFDDLRDLVTSDGTTVAFRHPLIRSAIYHGASPTERRAAHAALAAALEAESADPDRRAWHLGQAAEGPDERVAEELERSAERTMRRAGPASAAAALQRAAELSMSDARRVPRLVAAADGWWQGGDVVRAEVLLEQAERVDPLPEGVRPDIAGLRALIELRSGIPGDAVALLRPLVPDALQADRRRGVHLLMVFGEACFHANAAEAYSEIAAILERAPLQGADADAVLLRLCRGASRVRDGRASGLAPGDLEVVDELTDPVRLCWAGGMALGVGDPDLARRLRHQAVRRARTLGAAGPLAWALEYLVFDEAARCRFDTAEAYAEEGYRLAVETRQPNMACRHQGWLALVAALRGHEGEARRLADEVLAEAGKRRLAGAAANVHRALGLLNLAAGRPSEAMAHFEAMDRGDDSTHPGIGLYNVAELVEAAVRADQPDRAAEPFSRFAAWSDATGSPELLALSARCRALLATGDTAETEFRRAIELHAQTDRPMEQARTELLFGEYLRRARRRTEARTHLRAALETFDRLGVPVWADRARDELRATGETARRREPTTLETLTPQELRIAAAVSEGATNREVAAQLFLSPRTVDYHLRKVFQKLEISSRAELIRLTLAARGDEQGP